MKRSTSVFAFALVTVVTFGLAAEPDVSALAERLAGLRAEVDSLSTRVERLKETRRADRRSFTSQKADLEFQLQRERGRLAQIDAQIEKRRETIATASSGNESLVPAVTASLKDLTAHVERSLPFKREERLGEINKLQTRLSSGDITPQRAAVQAWALVEDELRLTRENGLYRQTIKLNGDELLVDIARLGMVAMYFRTEDGRVGWVVRDDLGWNWVPTHQQEERRQIAVLFDALEKQIRTGWFELPGLADGGAR